MPRCLDLFSGSGSIAKAFRAAGWEVVTLDADVGCNADIRCDILQWDCPYPAGHFDHIHASPPCTEFSRALTTRPRDLVAGLRVAERALDLIEQLKPNTWTLENPGSGLLPQQERFAALPCRLVTYCKYEGFMYKKLSWYANNLGEHWAPPEPCCKLSPCGKQVGRRHPLSAQRGTKRDKDGETMLGGRCSQMQLFSIPAALCDEIAEAATRALKSPP